MRTLLRILSCFLAALAAFSCQIELPVVETAPEQYHAVMDDATKVGIDGGMELFWNSADKISLFTGTDGAQYTFAGSDGDKEGYFYGTSPDAVFDNAFALYPWNADATCTAGGKIGVTIPDVQHYRTGGFDRDANLMVAATEGADDHELRFSNVCGYVRLGIYGPVAIKSITISGLSGEKLSGAAEITVSSSEAPSLKVKGDGTSITLDCGSGTAIRDNAQSAQTFWLAVPPVKFSAGFQIAITTTAGCTVVKKTVSKFEIKRNTVSTINPFRVAAEPQSFISFGVRDNGGTLYGAFDLAGPDITVRVPSGTDLSALVPVFEFNGRSVTSNSAAVTSGETVMDFDFPDISATMPFTIDGNKSYNVRVISSDLPFLFVSTPGHADIVDKDNWISPSTIHLVAADGKTTDLGLTGIRGRGNTSWSKPKKPYNLKLAEKQSVLGFKKHKRWRLMAGWFGLTNNDLYLEAARRTSMGWSPRGDFVELVLNGRWQGVYWLCEHMSVDKNRMNIAEMEPSDLSEPEITGGYLLQFDTTFDEDPKFKTSYFNLPVMVSSLDEDAPEEQVRWIRNYLDNFEASLMDESRLAAGEFFDYIDEDSFYDWFWLMEIAEKNDMRFPRSVFMHKDRGGKLAMGPVWDFDFQFFRKDVSGGPYHIFQLKSK